MTTYNQAEQYLKQYNHQRRVSVVAVVAYIISSILH